MTVPAILDAAGWLRNYLDDDVDGGGDLVRVMLSRSPKR